MTVLASVRCAVVPPPATPEEALARTPVSDSNAVVAGVGGYLLRPTTPTGEAWIEEHIEPGALWFGGGVVVEHRYIRDIVVGAISDGLKVR